MCVCVCVFFLEFLFCFDDLESSVVFGETVLCCVDRCCVVILEVHLLSS